MSCHRRSSNQTQITEILVIPEHKPDIERILRVTSTPEVRKTPVIRAKVVVTGDVDICVEYVGATACRSQPVHFVSFKVPLAFFIDHRCAKSCNDASVSASVEFQETKIIDRRRLGIFLILRATVLKLETARIKTKSQVVSVCSDERPAFPDTDYWPSASCLIDVEDYCKSVECNLRC